MAASPSLKNIEEKWGEKLSFSVGSLVFNFCNKVFVYHANLASLFYIFVACLLMVIFIIIIIIYIYILFFTNNSCNRYYLTSFHFSETFILFSFHFITFTFLVYSILNTLYHHCLFYHQAISFHLHAQTQKN